jgi:hypothetical protein
MHRFGKRGVLVVLSTNRQDNPEVVCVGHAQNKFELDQFLEDAQRLHKVECGEGFHQCSHELTSVDDLAKSLGLGPEADAGEVLEAHMVQCQSRSNAKELAVA